MADLQLWFKVIDQPTPDVLGPPCVELAAGLTDQRGCLWIAAALGVDLDTLHLPAPVPPALEIEASGGSSIRGVP